jgi:hypothetical protein
MSDYNEKVNNINDTLNDVEIRVLKLQEAINSLKEKSNVIPVNNDQVNRLNTVNTAVNNNNMEATNYTVIKDGSKDDTYLSMNESVLNKQLPRSKSVGSILKTTRAIGEEPFVKTTNVPRPQRVAWGENYEYPRKNESKPNVDSKVKLNESRLKHNNYDPTKDSFDENDIQFLEHIVKKIHDNVQDYLGGQEKKRIIENAQKRFDYLKHNNITNNEYTYLRLLLFECYNNPKSKCYTFNSEDDRKRAIHHVSDSTPPVSPRRGGDKKTKQTKKGTTTVLSKKYDYNKNKNNRTHKKRH